MKGITEAVNPRNGMAVVCLDSGDYMVLEPLAWDFTKGETISGLKEELGCQLVMFGKGGGRQEVWVEDIYLSQLNLLPFVYLLVFPLVILI